MKRMIVFHSFYLTNGTFKGEWGEIRVLLDYFFIVIFRLKLELSFILFDTFYFNQDNIMIKLCFSRLLKEIKTYFHNSIFSNLFILENQTSSEIFIIDLNFIHLKNNNSILAFVSFSVHKDA